MKSIIYPDQTQSGPLEMFLIDGDGGHHTLMIGPDSLELDGQQAIVTQWSERVQFTLLNSDGPEVHCAPGALWYAVAGAGVAPTADEAGGFLAENLARWSQWHTLSKRFAPPPMLPFARMDAFTEQALARCDGSPAAAQALSYLLAQPIETILAWLGQRGKQIVEEVVPTDRGGDQSTQSVANTPVPVRIQKAESEQFAWSTDMVETLKQEFLASSEATSATIQTIATRHQWKLEAVRYKVYYLRLPDQRNRQREEQTPADAGKEADRSPSEDL